MEETIKEKQAIVLYAKRGASKKNGRMCEGCAFIPNTMANDSLVTVEDALDCIYYQDKKFMCHLEDKVCTGFLNASDYIKKKCQPIK